MDPGEGEKGDVSAVGGITGERDGARRWSLTGPYVYGRTEDVTNYCTSTVFDTMRSLRVLFGILALGTVAVVGGGAGCSMLTNADDDSSPTVEQGVATVDSLHAPARVAPSDTLSLRLTGTVGPNGCYSFDGFDVERSPDRLRIVPVVTQQTGEGLMCTQAIVPLDEVYAAAPPFAEGPLTVVVPQPDRPDVTATVDVTADE